MIDTSQIVVAVTALTGAVGAVSFAADKWRGANRSERNDHQACLDKQAELIEEFGAHVKQASARSAVHDLAISAVSEKLERCEEMHQSSKEHVDVLSRRIRDIERSTTQPPRGE